jgi:hypothetical protein
MIERRIERINPSAGEHKRDAFDPFNLSSYIFHLEAFAVKEIISVSCFLFFTSDPRLIAHKYCKESVNEITS